MASKDKRTSMSNSPITMRGANAFFGDDEPVEQQKGKTVEQEDVLLVEQQNSERVKQQDGRTVEQSTGKTVKQQDGKVELVKVTYYITPEQDLKLDRIRLARRGKDRNKRVDKSGLIREAIEAMQE